MNIPSLDWKLLDAVILEIHNLKNPESLEDFVLHRMADFLGASFASWNIHDSNMRMTRVTSSRDYQERVAALIPTLNTNIHTNPTYDLFFEPAKPVVRYIATVERTRDHCSDEEYYATGFYKNVAKFLEIEDQLIMHVCVKGDYGIVLTFHNNQKFTDEQLLLASILRGHILARLYTITQKTDSHHENRLKIIAQLKNTLTDREFQTLKEVSVGKTSLQVADILNISSRTIDKHVAQILSKLGLNTRNHLIATYAPWLNDYPMRLTVGDSSAIVTR